MLGLALWLFVNSRKSPAVSERQVATRMLAEYLRKTFKPKFVLVISNPFSELSGRSAQIYNFEKAGVAGLKDGFGLETPLKVVFPKLKPEVLADPSSVQVDPKSTTPLSFFVTAQAFDDLFLAHPQCDLAISLIGLPVNLPRMKAWNKAGLPRFALLLPDWRMIGDPSVIENSFASAKLAAAIVLKPVELNTAGVAHPNEAASKFLLVTRNNVSELVKDLPRLFAP